MTEDRPAYTVDREAAAQASPIADKFFFLLRSRKFWAGIVGLVFVLVGSRAGVDQATLTNAVLTIVAYILGTALEDGLRGSS